MKQTDAIGKRSPFVIWYHSHFSANSVIEGGADLGPVSCALLSLAARTTGMTAFLSGEVVLPTHSGRSPQHWFNGGHFREAGVREESSLARARR